MRLEKTKVTNATELQKGYLIYSPLFSSILKITLPVRPGWIIFRFKKTPIFYSVIDQILRNFIREFLLFFAAG